MGVVRRLRSMIEFPQRLNSLTPKFKRTVATLTVNQLPLAPLGAGDLIDRAVRLYRRHFTTLIRIAAPPVVISAAGGVMTSISWRALMATGSETSLALYGVMLTVGLCLWFGGLLLNVIVMGGAARNLVTHLLWDEPVSARATYRNARARFWSLLGSTTIIVIITFIVFVIIFYIWALVFTMVAFGIVLLQFPAWLSAILSIISVITVTTGALWLFFLIAGRFAYVPQVMLVEGKGVFASIGRSASLASGNVKRLMAMVFFSSFATYSALMILLVPLGWYAYLNGVNPSPLDSQQWPAWYAISYQVVVQLSSILLTPVWMLGLSLLYVDERVRHEGYDIELMAARRLGEIPKLYGGHNAPIAPALASGAAHNMPPPRPTYIKPPAPPRRPPNSTLGLG